MKTKKTAAKILQRFHLEKTIAPADRRRMLGAQRRSYRVFAGMHNELAGKILGFNLFTQRMKAFTAAGAAAVLLVVCAASLQSYIFPERCAVVVASRDGSTVTHRGVSSPVSPAAPVTDGDAIAAGADSPVIVQTDDGLTLRFEPGTKAEIMSLRKRADRGIRLEEGTILARVGRLGKNDHFRIFTPAAAVEVRGTEFLTRYHEGACSVAVKSGKVAVTGRSGKETVLPEGSAADIGEISALRMQTADEAAVLERLSKIPDAGHACGMDRASLERMFSEAVKPDRNDASQNAEPRTIEGLRAKYSHIDTVTLFSEKEIVGVILERGSVLRILTVSGIVEIPAKDVQRTVSR